MQGCCALYGSTAPTDIASSRFSDRAKDVIDESIDDAESDVLYLRLADVAIVEDDEIRLGVVLDLMLTERSSASGSLTYRKIWLSKPI